MVMTMGSSFDGVILVRKNLRAVILEKSRSWGVVVVMRRGWRLEYFMRRNAWHLILSRGVPRCRNGTECQPLRRVEPAEGHGGHGCTWSAERRIEI